MTTIKYSRDISLIIPTKHIQLKMYNYLIYSTRFHLGLAIFRKIQTLYV